MLEDELFHVHQWQLKPIQFVGWNQEKCPGVGGQKFIFNIGVNKFRMAAMVWIENEKVYVLKLWTHAEYDKEKF